MSVMRSRARTLTVATVSVRLNRRWRQLNSIADVVVTSVIIVGCFWCLPFCSCVGIFRVPIPKVVYAFVLFFPPYFHKFFFPALHWLPFFQVRRKLLNSPPGVPIDERFTTITLYNKAHSIPRTRKVFDAVVACCIVQRSVFRHFF